MTFILTILAYVALVFFGWIAFYLLVFTASIAWHAGAMAERRNSNKELRKLQKTAERLKKTIKRLQGEVKDFLGDEIERQGTVH